MQIKNIIEKHQVKLRHTVVYKFRYNKESITLNDQEEACTDPRNAYYFAALNIPGTDIVKCQEAACEDQCMAYLFAKEISDANIEYCQKNACKDLRWAIRFAEIVPGADIEYCRKACEHYEYWLNAFDQMIAEKNANKKSNRLLVFRKAPG